MSRIIDFRSDTLTQPTQAMRTAMAEAVVGDDQLGEDPTVQRLEELAALKLGKEAALLVSSATQANLIATLTHTRPGEDLILDAHSHIYLGEGGGLGALAGVVARPIRPGLEGLDVSEIAREINPTPSSHQPRTGLIAIENPSNMGGGTIMPLSKMADLAEIAGRNGIPIHLDGARLFNAAVALGVDAREITQHVSSVQIALSKGLCAPVGGILAGGSEFIARARRVRQMVGGGWRQAGVFAAAAIVALETMVDRLAEDNANARRLAEGIATIEGLDVDLRTVQTNMVYVGMGGLGLTGRDGVAVLDRYGIRCFDNTPTTVRLVCYNGITAADVDEALDILRRVAADRRGVTAGQPAGAAGRTAMYGADAR